MNNERKEFSVVFVFISIEAETQAPEELERNVLRGGGLLCGYAYGHVQLAFTQPGLWTGNFLATSDLTNPSGF